MVTITKTSFKEAAENSRGIKTNIARELGVTYEAVWKFCRKFPEYTGQVLERARKKAVGLAADKIYQYATMEDEDPRKMPTILKAAERIVMTQGKDEGWIERQQIDYRGQSENKIEVTIVDETRGDSSLEDNQSE